MRRILSISLGIAVLAASVLLAGCSGGDNTPTTQNNPAPGTVSTTGGQSTAGKEGGSSKMGTSQPQKSVDKNGNPL